MAPTFETVLEQARVLSAADRKRLAKILGETNGGVRSVDNASEDEAVTAALRAKVNEIIKSENPKLNSSAKVAEKIRKWNDRGYTL